MDPSSQPAAGARSAFVSVLLSFLCLRETQVWGPAGACNNYDFEVAVLCLFFMCRVAASCFMYACRNN